MFADWIKHKFIIIIINDVMVFIRHRVTWHKQMHRIIIITTIVNCNLCLYSWDFSDCFSHFLGCRSRQAATHNCLARGAARSDSLCWRRGCFIVRSGSSGPATDGLPRSSQHHRGSHRRHHLTSSSPSSCSSSSVPLAAATSASTTPLTAGAGGRSTDAVPRCAGSTSPPDPSRRSRSRGSSCCRYVCFLHKCEKCSFNLFNVLKNILQRFY